MFHCGELIGLESLLINANLMRHRVIRISFLASLGALNTPAYKNTVASSVDDSGSQPKSKPNRRRDRHANVKLNSLFPGNDRRLEAPSDEKPLPAASPFTSSSRVHNRHIRLECQLQFIKHATVC